MYYKIRQLLLYIAIFVFAITMDILFLTENITGQIIAVVCSVAIVIVIAVYDNTFGE